MKERNQALLLTLLLLVIVLIVLAYFNIDHDLKTVVVSLIVGVVGALTGLSVNLKSLQPVTAPQESTNDPQLIKAVQNLNQRLTDAELWQAKVHEVLIKKNAKGQDKATSLGLKAGDQLNLNLPRV